MTFRADNRSALSKKHIDILNIRMIHDQLLESSCNTDQNELGISIHSSFYGRKPLNIFIPKATTPDIVDFIIKSTTNTGILTSLGDPNKNGDTALHRAAANKIVNFMPVFLKHLDTIPVNATNKDGLSALDVAVKNDNIPAAQALLNNRAKITDQTKKLASAEMQAILKPFETKE